MMHKKRFTLSVIESFLIYLKKEGRKIRTNLKLLSQTFFFSITSIPLFREHVNKSFLFLVQVF